MEIQSAETEQRSEEKRLKKKEALLKRKLKANMKEAKKLDEETNVDLDNTGLFYNLFSTKNNEMDDQVEMDDLDSNESVNASDISSAISSDGSIDNSFDEDAHEFDENKKISLLEKQLNAQMEFLKNSSLNKKKSKFNVLSNELDKQVLLFLFLIIFRMIFN